MPFITFEGGEGAGKSTQIKLLADYLRGLGKTVVVTREPGGTAGSDELRRLLRSGIDWLPLSEVLIQFAARHEHVEKTIKPALNRGEFVLCDRFTDSTIAYQGYGMGVALEIIAQVQRLSIGNFKPDLTFLLDLDPAAGLERAVARDGNAERYEAMPLTFHTRLRNGFLQMAQIEPERWEVIEATAETDTIYRKIAAHIKERFAL